VINIKYLIWALLAGSFIPVVGILNGRVGRALGEPLHASILLFGVAILLAITVAVLAGRGLPNIDFRQLQPVEYLAGFVVAFYVISATVLAGKIGVANFIVMAVSGQIIFSLLIDHFGLFGAPIRPVNLLQFGGASMLLGGLVITQLANGK
jgi:transporter family-2 protein